ncbi:MAG: DUF364 domain-containing protein [Oscillospiraceae bacterium]|nr:DUF364 domain-containing protein [Oscillospiraceae bacterium]
MWTLYDELIGGIPEDIQVDQYMAGCVWTMVRAGKRAGVALTVKSSSFSALHDGPITGAPLRNIAKCIKSWDFIEASIGMAAINAYYNTLDHVEALGGVGTDQNDSTLKGRKKQNAFVAFANEIAGKNVTVVGHFPNLEQQLKPVCNLSILERNPSSGDYPDSACEYILPQQDFVFITGMTLINKTLPRLLEIIDRKAKVSLVGPSVPMSSTLFRHGVDNLSGFCVTNPDKSEETLRRGGRQIFQDGRMVSIDRKN